MNNKYGGQPKLKVGDVITGIFDASNENTRITGTVIEIQERYTGIQEFGNEGQTRWIYNEYLPDFKFCKGMTNMYLCKKCNFRFECWTN